MIISLGDQTTPTTDARRLQRVLMEGLRTGDLVARLDAGSYIVMLTGASAESTRTVLQRVEQMFRKAYTNSNAHITFRTSQLKPLAQQ